MKSVLRAGAAAAEAQVPEDAREVRTRHRVEAVTADRVRATAATLDRVILTLALHRTADGIKVKKSMAVIGAAVRLNGSMRIETELGSAGYEPEGLK